MPNKGSIGEELHQQCLDPVRRPRGSARALCWRFGRSDGVGFVRFEARFGWIWKGEGDAGRLARQWMQRGRQETRRATEEARRRGWLSSTSLRHRCHVDLSVHTRDFHTQRECGSTLRDRAFLVMGLVSKVSAYTIVTPPMTTPSNAASFLDSASISAGSMCPMTHAY